MVLVTKPRSRAISATLLPARYMRKVSRVVSIRARLGRRGGHFLDLVRKDLSRIFAQVALDRVDELRAEFLQLFAPPR